MKILTRKKQETVSFAEEFCCINKTVIAWKHLPEPYKAGEKE